jgi:hypothetical protein
LTVRDSTPEPATAEFGERLVRTGCGGVIVKLRGRGVICPSAETLTEAVPAAAIRFAGMVVVNWTEDTNVVGKAAPFQRMVVSSVKPKPFTARVKAGLPATALPGVRLVSVKGGSMVKESGDGETCPGAETPTDAVPAVATRLSGTIAVSFAAEIKDVESVAPFHVTTVPGLKPEPATFSVNPGLPAMALFGEMLVSISGPLMVKMRGVGET